MRLERLIGVYQLEVEVAQQSWKHLVDLENGQIAPNTDVSAAAELHQVSYLVAKFSSDWM